MRSSMDGVLQPVLWYNPDSNQPRPLLVGLHTWSRDYAQLTGSSYAEWCRKQGWAFIHPNYRGANNSPKATGSDLAVQDVMDAVSWAQAHADIDPTRIYAAGYSGGGHMGLLLAGRHPDVWAGVSVWSPVTDLVAWYAQVRKNGHRHYQRDLLRSCGGVPKPGSRAARSCRHRSPLTYLANARDVAIDLNTGIFDGLRGNSVPSSHTLWAFNLLAHPDDRLTPHQIAYIAKTGRVPPRLWQTPWRDPLYDHDRVVLRIQSENVRVTLFEGGHALRRTAALTWLADQRKAGLPRPAHASAKVRTPTVR